MIYATNSFSNGGYRDPERGIIVIDRRRKKIARQVDGMQAELGSVILCALSRAKK